MGGTTIERPRGRDLLAQRAAYSELLIDAVDSGGGMGFLPPLYLEEANEFWTQVAREADEGVRVVLCARVEGALAGSAQLVLSQRSNSRHRAEVQKVMVHRRYRRRGIGLALMQAVDEAAREAGRTTLFLDTFAHQPARRMYEAAGWTHAGDIPAFARTPEGTLEATSFYYKLLGEKERR